jgi:AraC-like DNA-binding protein
MKIAILVGSGRVLLEPNSLIIVRSGMLDVHFPYSALVVDPIHAFGTGDRPLAAQTHGVCELAVFSYARPGAQVRRWAVPGAAFFEQLMPCFEQAAHEAPYTKRVVEFIEGVLAENVPFSYAGLSPKVHKMQARLNACLDRPLNLSELAAHSGLGTFAASRLFHEATGMTLRSYARRVRLRNAIARMRTDRNLTRIAQDFGFCDLAHFSKAFKADFGFSPSVFRKALERGWNVA